ncbi:hypothetical protein EDM57_04315 [Brevibacillus gelatini]|uniref:Uncharacterized protein n=1 Tax=Brevibacillus gelatini TaxID=1655277 RepID=A0A3M8B7T0_9BACL|nr:hypothetical protein [Brevibacillus gelatini]RNB59373.1 hypothetical protein EDM57_04315 [Brevibacillus gelatini]
MLIKEDLRKKIEQLSKEMDKQLEARHYGEYSRLADIYVKLVREYELMNKPKFNGWTYLTNNYTTTDAVSKNPLKYSEIHCNEPRAELSE